MLDKFSSYKLNHIDILHSWKKVIKIKYFAKTIYKKEVPQMANVILIVLQLFKFS